jgi:hypothetical protein
METLRTLSGYGMFLFGLSVIFSIALFVTAWFRR